MNNHPINSQSYGSMRSGVFKALSLLVLISLLFNGACRPEAPAGPEREAQMTLSAEATEQSKPSFPVVDDGRPLAPQVISMSPGPGQELSPDGEILISFDQAMDQEKTTSALAVNGPDAEAVKGKATWADAQTLVFKPERPFESGAVYQVRLGEGAASQAGARLRESFTSSFNAVGELGVTQVFPADGVQDAAVDSTITVIFNRPVAPLVIAEEQGTLPDPIQIDPPVSGSGEWVNTSAYTFYPDAPLAAGTTYTAVIPPGLQDAAGESALTAETRWQFTTQMPKIESFELLPDLVNPENGIANVRLDASFAVNFLQPMDPVSTGDAIAITSDAGEPASLETIWNEDFTRVVITPTQNLSLGTLYQLSVAETAQASSGGSLEQAFEWNFTTVLPPGVISVSPGNGSVQPVYERGIQIQFASPMRIDTVKSRIQVAPAPDEEIQWWYDEWNFTVHAFFLEPSTQYTVELQPGMEDLYGNPINQGQTVRFTTARRTPSAMLQMPNEPALMRAGDEQAQSFFVRAVNVDSYSLRLFRLQPDNFSLIVGYNKLFEWEYAPPPEDLVWETSGSGRGAENEWVLDRYNPLLPGGDLLPPGFYFLALDAPGVFKNGPYVDTSLILVSTANLTFKTGPDQAVLWLTDLNSGTPLEGIPLTVYDSNYEPIARGTTGESGLLELEIPVRSEPETLVVLSDENEEGVFAFAASNWGSDVPTYEFGIYGPFFSPANRPTVYIYTERPIYRPGQPVYFKGIVRVDDDLDYRLPEAREVEISIEDFQETVFRQTYPISEFGTFNGEFRLDSEAALGSYSILVRYTGFEDVIGSVAFTVAEYRRPEFQVEVQTIPEETLGGGDFTAEIAAEYYSGGAVGNAEVAWTLSAEPYRFDSGEEYFGYSFYDDELEEAMRGEFFNGPPSPEVIASGSGVTGPDGRLSLTLPADLSESGTGRLLTVEAMITDLSQNLVSGRSTITVHPAQVYSGVRPENYIGIAGDEQTFDLVAVDWGGEPVSGQELAVEVVEQRWYSVQEQDASGYITWTSAVEEIPVTNFEDIVTGEDGEAVIRFTPEGGGIYKAKVTARDAAGNRSRAAAYLWVAGDEFIPWRQTNDHSFDLVADRREYQPGDTAQLLIASPYQGPVYALVTVERGRVRQQEVILLENNSTLYNLAITPDMAPNVYVSVLIVKGVDDTNPRPGFKMGIVQLHVTPDIQELQVEIVPDQESAGPGDTVVYQISTRDSQGAPVSAELSLGLSDLATLSLMDPNSPAILDYFYNDRSLNVWTSVPLVLSIEDYNAEIEEQIPPEGGGMGSGGGKGGGEFGVVEVRQDFPDTAFWGANIVTNDSGEAVVSVTLPDNLTTWRMDARAVTPDTHVGQSTHDLVSSRPLLVRPQTPRFLVAGDVVTIGAAVHNNTDQSFTVNVSLESEGMEIAGEAVQTIEVGSRQQVYVTWSGTVSMEANRVDFLFTAEGGGYRDVTRPAMGTLEGQGIPVYQYEAFETVATSGQVGPGETEIEAIYLPSEMDVRQGTLNVEIAPSLAAGVTDGLSYLEHYPYECVEQTVSRFLPNVITTRALRVAGITDAELETKLGEQVNQALQRLYNWQNPDGGWGWWPRSNQEVARSDALTSTYVVLGLIEAQSTGYEISQPVLERGLNYLTGQVGPISRLSEPYKANRQMFILYVLARAGFPDVSATVQLYEQRQTLAIYALGFLVQTLAVIDPEDPRIDTLLSDLASGAVTSATGAHWEESNVDPWNWNTDTRTTAIVLSALSGLDTDNPLNANAVRWLMKHRTEGHWRGTQETAWTLMALTNWMAASGELNTGYRWGIGLNGATIGDGTADSENLRQTQVLEVDVASLIRGEANRLAFARDEGSGTMYYSAHLDLALPVDRIQALDRGILVSRSYYPVSTLQAEERFTDPITSIQQGELVLVRLTLVAPHDLHYVVVDDPLPAGLEAVDQSLKSSPQTSVPQDYRWEDMFSEGWGWWYFDYVQLRDEKVVLSADTLPAGTYVYTYLARAATPGTFQVLPPVAQEIYFPEVYGRGEGSSFIVEP